MISKKKTNLTMVKNNVDKWDKKISNGCTICVAVIRPSWRSAIAKHNHNLQTHSDNYNQNNNQRKWHREAKQKNNNGKCNNQQCCNANNQCVAVARPSWIGGMCTNNPTYNDRTHNHNKEVSNHNDNSLGNKQIRSGCTPRDAVVRPSRDQANTKYNHNNNNQTLNNNNKKQINYKKKQTKWKTI